MRIRCLAAWPWVFCGAAFAATPAEQALKQKVDQLQAQNAAQDRQIAILQAELKKAKSNDGADDKTIANLKQQIEQLQAELKKSRSGGNADEKTILGLRMQVDQLQAELKKAKGNDGADDKAIKTLQTQLDSLRKVKTVRTIVYRLKPDSPKAEIQSLADDANQFFATAKPVRGVWAGRAAGENGEHHAVIVLLFDDANGLLTFQKDPQWKRFTDKHAGLWEEPRYYDGTIGK
jgi:chromosome segregation ATPase